MVFFLMNGRNIVLRPGNATFVSFLFPGGQCPIKKVKGIFPLILRQVNDANVIVTNRDAPVILYFLKNRKCFQQILDGPARMTDIVIIVTDVNISLALTYFEIKLF